MLSDISIHKMIQLCETIQIKYQSKIDELCPIKLCIENRLGEFRIKEGFQPNYLDVENGYFLPEQDVSELFCLDEIKELLSLLKGEKQ